MARIAALHWVPCCSIGRSDGTGDPLAGKGSLPSALHRLPLLVSEAAAVVGGVELALDWEELVSELCDDLFSDRAEDGWKSLVETPSIAPAMWPDMVAEVLESILQRA